MLRYLRNGLIGLAVCTVTAAASAQAETFTLLLFESPGDLSARDDKGTAGLNYWKAYNTYAGILKSAGALRGGSALIVNEGVATVESSRTRHTPFLPSGLKLGGFFIIEAADMSAAEALAKQAPAVLHGAVEIHQNASNPTMAAH